MATIELRHAHSLETEEARRRSRALVDQFADKLKAAVLGEPQNIDNRWQLAQTYMKVSAYPQAVSELQAIVRISPDNLRALQLLGQAAARMDNWELAANTWQKAFQVSPDDTGKQGLFEARLKLYQDKKPFHAANSQE